MPLVPKWYIFDFCIFFFEMNKIEKKIWYATITLDLFDLEPRRDEYELIVNWRSMTYIEIIDMFGFAPMGYVFLFCLICGTQLTILVFLLFDQGFLTSHSHPTKQTNMTTTKLGVCERFCFGFILLSWLYHSI